MKDSKQEAEASDEHPAIPRSVVINLVTFSVLMATAPLATYYLLYYILKYSSTLAGISAAVSANIVLFCYIIIAYMEDDKALDKQE
jgi:hypothetical protein